MRIYISKIVNPEVRKGVTNGRPWTLRLVLASIGGEKEQRYLTFYRVEEGKTYEGEVKEPFKEGDNLQLKIKGEVQQIEKIKTEIPKQKQFAFDKQSLRFHALSLAIRDNQGLTSNILPTETIAKAEIFRTYLEGHYQNKEAKEETKENPEEIKEDPKEGQKCPA